MSPDLELLRAIRMELQHVGYFYAESPELIQGVPCVILRAEPECEYVVKDGRFEKLMSFGAIAKMEAGGTPLADARLGVLLSAVKHSREMGYKR